MISLINLPFKPIFKNNFQIFPSHPRLRTIFRTAKKIKSFAKDREMAERGVEGERETQPVSKAIIHPNTGSQVCQRRRTKDAALLLRHYFSLVQFLMGLD